MTQDESAPIPEPAGDLAPPVRHPPTAVGASAPSPEPRRTPAVPREARDLPQLLAALGRAVTTALDALDAAGDAVAERLGIRRSESRPPE